MTDRERPVRRLLKQSRTDGGGLSESRTAEMARNGFFLAKRWKGLLLNWLWCRREERR